MDILVIKPSSLGDVIHALPCIKALKDSFPDSRIDWVISSSLKGLLEGNPLIDNLILLNKDSWKNIKKLPATLSEISSLRKTLKSKRYDIVIDLQGLLRSGLIAFTSPSTTKVGFADAREGSSFFYNKKVAVSNNLHAVDKCLEVAKSIGANVNKAVFPLHIDPSSKNSIKELLGSTVEYIVIAPSARWNSKIWPAEKFASLISKITIPCVIAGSEGDSSIANIIIESVSEESRGNIINLCGKTNLKELAALIAGAKAVVSNDSGPMHIAAALDIPAIAIFGPTDPVKTGPYGWQTNDNLSVINADLPCRPCRKRNCDDLICMKIINAATVLKKLKEYL